ncbi:hypothetical protein M1N64_04075, partial [Peptococcaceae bacterium]|nr:hypothetical protein [Peptococcaceae bacterium]
MTPVDIGILGLILGAILGYYLTKFWRTYKLKRQLKTAKRAEKNAEAFLKQQGYAVIATQLRVPVTTKIDGHSYQNHVKADFIVKKKGLKYVVEVKTGEQVERPTSASIRRQLLEYYLIYRTDGVLLLDMKNKKLYTLEFQLKTPLSTKKYFTH